MDNLIRRHVLFPLAGAALLCCVGMPSEAQQPGRFVGELILKDTDPDGRKFELVEPFGYIDPNGIRWQAEKGIVVDGASIPQPLWSIVGGPYEGPYRRASVIHDFYCDRKYRSWESVHQVFYDAMITGGVGSLKAKLMYYAVWRFGPRWSVTAIVPCVSNPQIGKFCASATITKALEVVSERPVLTDQTAPAARRELEEVATRLSNEQLSLEQLQALADSKPAITRSRTMTRQEHIGSAISIEKFDSYKVLEEASPDNAIPNLLPPKLLPDLFRK